MPQLPPIAARAQAPAELPLPGQRTGLTWRGLTRDDVEPLHDLFARIEAADDPPYRTAVAETQERFEADWRGATENVLGGWDEGGVLRAYAAVSLPPGEAGPLRVYLEGGVDPDRRGRGIGGLVLDWELGRARQLLAGSGRDEPARLVVEVEDDATSSVHLLVSRGFRPARYYTELRRDLRADMPPTSLARPLEIVPWRAELDEQVRLAHNEAFAEHWVSEPQTKESWIQGRTYFAPEWSSIVLDRTSDRAQVVGYLLSGRYEQDWPSLGWREGYIDLLGVRPTWRGRGIATALVLRAMRAYADAGLDYASLGVDTDSPGKVFGLYSRLEFEPTRGSTMYTIEL